jgi:hypothetical protein
MYQQQKMQFTLQFLNVYDLHEIEKIMRDETGFAYHEDLITRFD